MLSSHDTEEATPYSRVGSLLAVTLVLVIVLVVCYLCIRFLKKRRPICRQRGSYDRFGGWVPYLPSCSGRWYSDRHGCTGVTSGAIPSVETAEAIPPCRGACTGVPPPEYISQINSRQN
jgi:hypothetical protein